MNLGRMSSSPLLERVAVCERGLARHRLQLEVREEVILREQRDVGRHLGGAEEEGEEGRWRAGWRAAAGENQVSPEQRRISGSALPVTLGRLLGVPCHADLDPATLSVLHEDYFGHRVRAGSLECYRQYFCCCCLNSHFLPPSFLFSRLLAPVSLFLCSPPRESRLLRPSCPARRTTNSAVLPSHSLRTAEAGQAQAASVLSVRAESGKMTDRRLAGTS